MTHEDIIRAAGALKVLMLANNPEMDEVAIRLNCGLDWDEKEVAKRWALAFSIASAQPDLSVFDIAVELHKNRHAIK